MINAPFWVGNGVRYFVTLCHRLGEYGNMACGKPVKVLDRQLRVMVGPEAEQIFGIAKAGIFNAVERDGKLVAPGGSEDTAPARPKTFVEASAKEDDEEYTVPF